jgi:hypothetical protein
MGESVDRTSIVRKIGGGGCMGAKGQGYSTLFRELQTPEGDFHATFANTNANFRRRVKALGAQYPNDPRIQKFVGDMERDRTSLWEAWKRGGLSPAMRKIVNSVREAHHGPNVLGEDE